MNLYEKLNSIQQELKAPKDQHNDFGNFWYRSCEGILESVKPLCEKNKVTLVIYDEPVCIEGWHYIKATATLFDNESESVLSITGYAREPLEKTKMDLMQITGATSSYARKYALNGLFCIDDNKDSDTNEYQTNKDEIISNKISLSLREEIKKKEISTDKVQELLKKYNHTKLSELKMTELIDFKKEIGI